MEKVSIRDVASRAGVSVSTVSRALSRPEMVSESTRRKIQAIAEELDFSVSRTAGNLKSGKSRRIALLVGSNKIEWFTANIMEGLNSVILDQGYDLVFYPISSVEDRRAFFEELPVRNNVDAVVISSFTATAKEITRLHSAHVPLVGINSPSTLNFSATVHTSDRTGMKLAIRHLSLLGHRKILYIYQTFHSSIKFSSYGRIQAFKDACAKKPGITGIVKSFENPHEAFDALTTGILSEDDPPTAVCVHQDSQALPFLFRAQSIGLSIPDDLSIMGYDDSSFAQDVGLTTIRQDPYAMGREAASKALQLIESREPEIQHEEFPVELVVRRSTGEIRKHQLF